MIQFFDRVHVETATTGTGAVTLGAAIPGMMTALEAGVSDADEVSYVIEDGLDFEIGWGVIGGSGTTMTRTVIRSKISGTVGTSAIDLSGDATVFLNFGAADIFAHPHADATDATPGFMAAADKGKLDGIASGAQVNSADTVLSSATKNLTVGYTSTAVDEGTKSSGTFTPTPATGNMKRAVNGGAHTLAAPSASGDYTIVIQYTNNGSAGTITRTGFTRQTGDSFTTTNGHDFLVYITKLNGFTHLHVVALQ